MSSLLEWSHFVCIVRVQYCSKCVSIFASVRLPLLLLCLLLLSLSERWSLLALPHLSSSCFRLFLSVSVSLPTNLFIPPSPPPSLTLPHSHSRCGFILTQTQRLSELTCRRLHIIKSAVKPICPGLLKVLYCKNLWMCVCVCVSICVCLMHVSVEFCVQCWQCLCNVRQDDPGRDFELWQLGVRGFVALWSYLRSYITPRKVT